jgi:hypothetical protein
VVICGQTFAKESIVNLEEVKKRFVEEVKLRAYDDKYVDRKEEREILQIAIQNNISIDAGVRGPRLCSGKQGA